MDLDLITSTALAGQPITPEQALAVLRADDAETLVLVAAAGRVRRKFFGTKVRLNYLISLKSGLCPENCTYCSQALGSQAEILKYTWLDADEVRRAVAAGVTKGASTVCLVASGRGPSNREVDKVAGIVADIHTQYPGLKICTCLGFIDDDKAGRLKQAGSDRYNHNLNTAESHYRDLCTSHDYADRVQTVQAAQQAGLSSCSGLIAGAGESDEQLVEVAFALRELGADSVPVNFLLPFEGTPLESHLELTPQRCLRILAMMRLVHPDTELRSGAGREYHLRSLQPLVLEICNSIFLGDYLTSEGQAGAADLAMIADLGFEIEGDLSDQAGEICYGEQPNPEAVRAVDEHLKQLDAAGVPLRQRGLGAARA